jgi:hypothetical protein
MFYLARTFGGYCGLPCNLLPVNVGEKFVLAVCAAAVLALLERAGGGVLLNEIWTVAMKKGVG